MDCNLKPLDLSFFDLPQDQSNLEWWYFNAHLEAKNRKRLSVFASFFRKVIDVKSTERKFQDACTWALIDLDTEKYYSDSLLDHRACDILTHALDPEKTGRDCQHVEGPMLQLAKKNRLMRPDRQMKKPASVAKDHLSINLDDECMLSKRSPTPEEYQVPHAPKTVYEVHTKNPQTVCSTKLSFLPQQGVIKHGETGMVNEMLYYYIPRCSVKGMVEIEGEVLEVQGSGWYDREFGGSADDTGSRALDAWTWLSVQLSDNTEFSLFHIFDKDQRTEKEKVAIFTDGNQREVVTDFEVQSRQPWTSLSSFLTYPTELYISVPSLALQLTVKAAFKHQEFNTVLVTGGGFWEGRAEVTGHRNGTTVHGPGFVELKNFTPYKDTKGLLKVVGNFVRNTLAELYPLEATQEHVQKYVLGDSGLKVDSQLVSDILFRPVRALIDRGGKAWRSLILVATLNAVSKHYIDGSKYIALAELLHVGSLIIDDIQDESTVRRGGNCVHLDFGTATAINAGTACYFMAPVLACIQDLPAEKQLKIYNIYFDFLRMGHAGQGLDMVGLDHMMEDVVETGDASKLREVLQTIHILKTGGPAGSLCRIACILADATSEQFDVLETYGKSLGLAFQIVDDALNLRGFEGDLKELGEDIREGKITYPVTLAMSKLEKKQRKYLWTMLQKKSDDPNDIAAVIKLLDSVNAIDDCLKEARDIVRNTWELLDAVVEDSLPKLMLRTFGDYLTERTF